MTVVWRLLAAAGLVASGAMLYGASWQRWAAVCPLHDADGATCAEAQSGAQLLFPDASVVPPGATLAGLAILVLGLALLVLPWALTGARPGLPTAAALVVVVLAHAAVGVTSLRSGMSGDPVEPYLGEASTSVWLLLTPFVVGRLAVAGRGWARAATWVLVVALPFPALLTYAEGEWDSAPWWEARIGVVTAVAGLLMLVAAVRRTPALPAEGSGSRVAAGASIGASIGATT